MSEEHTRRATITAAVAVATGAAALTTPFSAAANSDPERAHVNDFAFLVGDWRVQHHCLKDRLEGSTEWQDFSGTTKLWLTMGGLGNVDDNVIQRPNGAYRAMTVRAFDPSTRKWAIWWLDGRAPDHLDPPVYGSFENGVGTFEGDDTLNGRPIKVRFRWSDIMPNSARWEQAFSADAGATWETNWIMRFTRAV